jgi:hypothetical protein
MIHSYSYLAQIVCDFDCDVMLVVLYRLVPR